MIAPWAALACVAVLGCAAPASAGPLAPLPTGDYVLPLAHGGLARQYLLHVPQGYTPRRAAPLVLAFHGTFGNARNIAEKTGLSDLADREGFIAVYPEAAGIQWNDGREDSTTRPPTDDVAFVSALIDHLDTMIVNVDRRRIYATGMSSGGMMAYRLGLQLADKIAAIAPVAAILDESLTGAPSAPVALIAFHGTADGTIDYDGRSGAVDGEGVAQSVIVGGEHPSAPESVGRWAGFNGCKAAPVVAELPDVDTSDGTRVSRLDHAPCKNRAAVELYRIEGGGHAWPGDRGGLTGSGAVADGTVSRDIDASELIWRFFERVACQRPRTAARSGRRCAS